MDQYELIRTAHFVYGKGIREIAREYGHSRKTVRKALQGLPPEYRREKEIHSPVMGCYQEIIDHWLVSDQSAHRKQRHTAHRIYKRLVSEHDFQGGESTVRRFVRQRKAALGLDQKEAMVPLEPEIDSGAEVDWGEAQIILAGVERKVKMFCMRSKYSGKIFARAYAAERQEMFFDGHMRAFEHFGGVFREHIYDNLTTAVKRVLRGRKRIEQEQFTKFRAYYAFQARYCSPGKGNEKGGVEGAVGYVRRNFMVPIPEVSSLESLNRHLLKECVAHGLRPKNGESRQTIDALHEEQKIHLIGNQAAPFANHLLLECPVDKYQTVKVDLNRYSVPGSYVGQRLKIHLGCEVLRIFAGRDLVAEQPRRFDRGGWELNPFHYLRSIGKKPGCFDEARPLKAWRKTWPRYYEILLDRLKASREEGRGTKAFIDVLKLHEIYPREVVEEAVRQCVEKGASCPSAVKHVIFSRLERPLPPTEKMDVSKLPSPTFDQPSLSQYDQLLPPRGES